MSFLKKREREMGEGGANIQSPDELNDSSFYYEAKQDAKQMIQEYLLGKLSSSVTIHLLCTFSYNCTWKQRSILRHGWSWLSNWFSCLK